MADGYAWEDLTVDLEAPGVSIRRKDLGGMAINLIRFAADEKTDEVFAGLPDDRCRCGHRATSSPARCGLTSSTSRSRGSRTTTC